MATPPLQSVKGVVEEIMRIHRSLPPRPRVDEVDASWTLVRSVDKGEQARIDAISSEEKGFEVPDDLFFVLQDMQKKLVSFLSKEQKRDALKLLDLERVHNVFDELIQRASDCIPSSSDGGDALMVPSAAPKASSDESTATAAVSSVVYSERKSGKGVERMSRDDSYLRKAKSSIDDAGAIGGGLDLSRGFSLNSTCGGIGGGLDVQRGFILNSTSGEERDKLSVIKLASLIEISSKKGARDLNLQNKLMDQVDWLPDSIGKLSDLITLDLSENRIVALPHTVGAFSSLRKLDLHSNRIAELPEPVGDLFSLVHLDLRGNQLTSLPSTVGKLVNLVELDLSSNCLSLLPDAIGSLISLRKLNVETNDIEELPHTISNCVSLVELRADYNLLKSLPEAVGRLGSLEILSVRYNNIKGLPTTMASLSRLKELDVSFNELESVPESLCLATTLVKLNLGNNFSDLQSLPRSIGNLELLEELDISNNQIRVLPDSFGMLSQLYVLHAEENPLEVPPRHIAVMGAQDVVLYMAEFVAKRAIKSQPTNNKKTWAQLCFFSRPSKRKHHGRDYVKPLNIKA